MIIVLGLVCMGCHNREQSARSSKNYPFAVVANNVTLMLIDLMKIRDSKYVSTPTVRRVVMVLSEGASYCGGLLMELMVANQSGLLAVVRFESRGLPRDLHHLFVLR